MNHSFFGWLLCALLPSSYAMADCIDDAAAYQQVHPAVLRAIAFNESGMRAATLNHNTNGTVDIGLMGINTVHLAELSRHGVDQVVLTEPCANAYVGAWYLKRMMVRHGNNWRAVGAYHSETPRLNAEYVARIQGILRHWGVMVAPKVNQTEATLEPLSWRDTRRNQNSTHGYVDPQSTAEPA
ncbi:MAG: lytic transglycosylase domain-containing protein [Pseudomonas sp.]|uniref:lytic transglycosylase domain-containing protein n=1 Tax=Stenotrophomonas sp. TaxID=69392 RepID=UPI003D6D9448